MGLLIVDILYRKNNMSISDRFIVAFYHALGGIVLGVSIAIYCSLYLSLSFSSAKIVFITVAISFAIGYLFPRAASKLFKWIWYFFTL